MEQRLKKLDDWILSVTDFFIRIFFLKKFRDKIIKILNPQTVIYLVVGVLTTIINLAVFIIVKNMLLPWQFAEFVANPIAWIVAVLATFYPNKYLVFRKPNIGASNTLMEFVNFVISRLATLAIEQAGITVFCTWLGFNGTVVKAILAVVVVVLNYVFSRLFVFKKKDKDMKNS